MRYKILFCLLLLIVVAPALAQASTEKPAPTSAPKGEAAPKAVAPGKMIGAAPVDSLLGTPRPPAKPSEKKEEAEGPAIIPTAPVPVTPGDYDLYLAKGHRDKAWDEWIKPAFESFDAENYSTASIFLMQAYEKGCRDPMVLFRLGIYKESRGETKEAAKILSEAGADAPKRYPGHPLANAIHRHAGRALYKVDNYTEALPHLKEALKYEPNDFMLLLMTGQIERLEKRPESARKYFERALEAPMPKGVTPDPKSTILGELIIITYDAKEFDACEKYIKMALAHDPNDKVANKHKGLVGRARFRKRELDIIKKITE